MLAAPGQSPVPTHPQVLAEQVMGQRGHAERELQQVGGVAVMYQLVARRHELCEGGEKGGSSMGSAASGLQPSLIECRVV